MIDKALCARPPCSGWTNLRQCGASGCAKTQPVFPKSPPVFCIPAAQATAAEPGSFGIVIGGSGNGEQMAANKVKGVRAALVWSLDTAKLAREHNNANVISVGGRLHSIEDCQSFIDVFLATPFSGDERHIRRINQMSNFEITGEIK